MAFKVALLGIYHESNTFLTSPTTLDDFKKGHWLRGNGIREEYQNAHHEIGGMLEVLDRENVEVVPIMFAEATPGGAISKVAYETLLDEMMEELVKNLPVDGCMVVAHGAAVSEVHSDMDGHWLAQLKKKLGANVPIVGTLDPHANVSPLMAASTNALIAYKTNPHIDQRQIGREAAGLMVRALKEKLSLGQALVQFPLAISIEQQYTGDDPCKSLFDYARKLSQRENILSISVLLGFPYADVEEMGSAAIVVYDGSDDYALRTCKNLETYILENKSRFIGEKKDIYHAIEEMEQLEKPVLLLDMGDNVGGGARGNSTFLLEVLERETKYKFFICLYDPAIVMYASKRKPGEVFEIKLPVNETNGNGHTLRVSLSKLITDGRFKEAAPRHGGQASFDMGETAIVITDKGNTIMINSQRIAPFSLKQLTAFNIQPEMFDILIAKGVNAPIAAYSSVCRSVIKVDTPGPTQADMTKFAYKHRRKPLYPFED